MPKLKHTKTLYYYLQFQFINTIIKDTHFNLNFLGRRFNFSSVIINKLLYKITKINVKQLSIHDKLNNKIFKQLYFKIIIYSKISCYIKIYKYMSN